MRTSSKPSPRSDSWRAGTSSFCSQLLDAEWVRIANTTGAAVNLKGWVLVDASNHKYTFTSYSLGKGKSVTIHTGKGTNTAANRYQGRAWYVWNNDKDKATLKRASGATQDTCSYNNAKKAYVYC